MARGPQAHDHHPSDRHPRRRRPHLHRTAREIRGKWHKGSPLVAGWAGYVPPGAGSRDAGADRLPPDLAVWVTSPSTSLSLRVTGPSDPARCTRSGRAARTAAPSLPPAIRVRRVGGGGPPERRAAVLRLGLGSSVGRRGTAVRAATAAGERPFREGASACEGAYACEGASAGNALLRGRRTRGEGPSAGSPEPRTRQQAWASPARPVRRATTRKPILGAPLDDTKREASR